jgi:hypothetical protein
MQVQFGSETAHHGQTAASVAAFGWWYAPATVVTDSDQELVVIDSGLQAHHRVRVVGRVGVFHRVGKALVDSQGEVINQDRWRTQCLQPFLETRA